MALIFYYTQMRLNSHSSKNKFSQLESFNFSKNGLYLQKKMFDLINNSPL